MPDEQQGQQPDPTASPPGWPPAPPYAAPPGWQPPPPPYGAPPGQPQGWYPPGYPPPYGYQGYPAYPRPRNTNGFAIAALVCSVAGLLLWFVGPLLGVIFGIVGLRQTTRLGEAGRGLAIAGIVIGAVLLVLDVTAIIGIAVDAGTGSGGVSVDFHPAAAALLRF